MHKRRAGRGSRARVTPARPPGHSWYVSGRHSKLPAVSLAGTARSALRLGASRAAARPCGLQPREAAVLLRSAAAAGWRQGGLRSRGGTLRPAGAGGGRLQVAASDARAGLHRRPLESSRRSSGARPRHGGSAPPVRAGAVSGGSGAGAKHIPAEAVGGRPGRPCPPCLGCACVIGVFCGPRGSRCVSCGDFPDYKDGLSGQLGHFCKVPRIFGRSYSQHPDC